MDDKLTDEQAEAMLKQLSRHYREPVMPMTRYCSQLQTWGHCIEDRARHLQKELFPNLNDYDQSDPKHWKPTPEAAAQGAEYQTAKARDALQSLIPLGLSVLSNEAKAEIVKLTLEHKKTEREYQLDELLRFQEAAHQIERTFLSIHKSNLLARLLYNGEKLRTQMCPEHKGKWSGIEFGDTVCPHKCQLTGWIQESADQGKPLPGVMAVNMVPTGEAPGEVTMIRSADGEVLGKAVVQPHTFGAAPLNPMSEEEAARVRPGYKPKE
jgi:hypothetical protein